MPLREIDRQLLDRCLGHHPRAWNDFVDRYMGLIYHVIHHVAHARSMTISEADIEDIAAEIFLAMVDDDYKVLRAFKGDSSLPTYLTVVARRICVKEVVKRFREAELGHTTAHRAIVEDEDRSEAEPVLAAEEVERMLAYAHRPRRRGRPALPSQISQLSPDQQATRDSRELRRTDPGQSSPPIEANRRPAQRELNHRDQKPTKRVVRVAGLGPSGRCFG